MDHNKRHKQVLENMKNFDPTLAVNDPATRWLVFQKLPYTPEEWDEYDEAKEKCLARRGNWQKEREPKFEKMANDYYKACRELEEMD